MGHTLDPPNAPVSTRIPFVNFSVITDPVRLLTRLEPSPTLSDLPWPSLWPSL